MMMRSVHEGHEPLVLSIVDAGYDASPRKLRCNKFVDARQCKTDWCGAKFWDRWRYARVSGTGQHGASAF
jgi:hypothetical protein